MARIRTIKPVFFRHHDLYQAEIESGLPLRVAFAGLWTAADRDGRFRWQPEALKLDCLPYDKVDFVAVLDCLAKLEVIASYKANGKTYGYIPSWHEHQRVHHTEVASKLPNPIANGGLTVKIQRERNKEGNMEGKGGVGENHPTPTTKRVSSLKDLKVDGELKEWARKKAPDVNTDEALGAFTDWCRSKAKPFKDYRAALRNWIRNEQKFINERNKPKGGSWRDI